MQQFVRFYRPSENKEMLIAVSSIWKIDVIYVLEGDKDYVHIALQSAMNNPKAIRFNKVFAGSEEIKVPSNPDDPVCQLLEDIYKNAIKA